MRGTQKYEKKKKKKAVVTKSVLYTDQWNGMKSPERNPHIYSQLILNDAKIIQREKRIGS